MTTTDTRTGTDKDADAGDEQNTSTDEQQTDGTDTDADGGDEADKWKAIARKHEREAKKLLAEKAKLEEANRTDTEKAIAKAREEAREEALAEALDSRIADAVTSAATVKLAKANYAALLPGTVEDHRVEFVDAAGNIDRAAIDKALEKLVKDNPHLAAEGQAQPLPGGGRNGGPGAGKGHTMNDLVRDRARR